MACVPSIIEKRPLKKPKIGPPDIYPQENKQREDELSAINVKQGYFDNPSYLEEYGSARPYSASLDNLITSFNSIHKRRKDINTFQDSNKKKPVLNIKDIFWPVTARSKSSVDSWFRDLAGNKSLILLAKRVPIFNKKDELFAQLYDSNVSLSRATWVIKLNAAHTTAMAENKMKKRQILDPYTDWTQALCKYMKELVLRLTVAYKKPHSGLPPNTDANPSNADGGLRPHDPFATASPYSSLTPLAGTPSPLLSPPSHPLHPSNDVTDALITNAKSTPSDTPGSSSTIGPGSNYGELSAPMTASVAAVASAGYEAAHLKTWTYIESLAWYMFREGLLDNQEYLTFICDLLEKALVGSEADSNDHILDLLLPFTLKYAQSFAKSYFISRRLAFLCATKITEIISLASQQANEAMAGPTTSIQDIDYSGADSESRLRIANYLPSASHIIESPFPDHVTSFYGTGGFHDDAGSGATSHGTTSVPFDLGQRFHHCPHHRHLVLNLSCILQVLVYACPSAMVWNDILGWSSSTTNHLTAAPGQGVGFNRPTNPAYLLGSPLDFLPLSPSELPVLAYTGQMEHIKKCLQMKEEHIRIRSEAADNLWSIEKNKKTSVGKVINRILEVLQALDQYDYTKCEPDNSIRILYARIFRPLPLYDEYLEEDVKEIRVHDEPIIFILCQWAISLQRRGFHRSMVASMLLMMRQEEYDDIFSDQDSIADSPLPELGLCHLPVGIYRDRPSLQSTLLKFLDLYAPTIQSSSRESVEMFSNLVLLYGEFIRVDVFSYESYLKTLICRNEIDTSDVQVPSWPLHMSQKTLEKNRRQNTIKKHNGLFSPPSTSVEGFPTVSNSNRLNEYQSCLDTFSVPKDANAVRGSSLFVSQEFIKVEESFDMVAGAAINEYKMENNGGPQLIYFVYPFSNLGFYKSTYNTINASSKPPNQSKDLDKRFSKHYQFLYHFPLYDSESRRAEVEQRHNALFGVGKLSKAVKAEVHALTRLAKKTFFAPENFYNPLRSPRPSSPDKVTFDSTLFGSKLGVLYERLNRFPSFDKVHITNHCTRLLIRLLQRYVDAHSPFLLRLECVKALFECLGRVRNNRAIVETFTDLCIELPRIQRRLSSTTAGTLDHKSNFSPPQTSIGDGYGYTIDLCAQLIGVARLYFNCLLACSDPSKDGWDIDEPRGAACIVFQGLLAFCKELAECPQGCSSPLRMIYSFMFDLWSSCHIVRTSPLLAEWSHALMSEIKRVMYGIVAPTPPPPPFPHPIQQHQATVGAIISWWDPYFFLEHLQRRITSPTHDRSTILNRNLTQSHDLASLLNQLEAHASKRYSFVCNSLLVLIARASVIQSGDTTGPCYYNEIDVSHGSTTPSLSACGSHHYDVLRDIRKLVQFCAEVTCQYQRIIMSSTILNNKCVQDQRRAFFPYPLPNPLISSGISPPPLLNGEWLGAFKALCCPTHHMHHQHTQQQHPHFLSAPSTPSCNSNNLGTANFVTVARNLVRSLSDTGRVDRLMLLYDSLAQLCLTLVLQHIFSLEDFIKHVALPSLLAAACPPPGGIGSGATGNTPQFSRTNAGHSVAGLEARDGADSSSTDEYSDESYSRRRLNNTGSGGAKDSGPAENCYVKFNTILRDRPAESGARLTCYLLFRLFKSFAPSLPPLVNSQNTTMAGDDEDNPIKSMRDRAAVVGSKSVNPTSRKRLFADSFDSIYERQILISYQHNISIGALLAVFKALVLASCIPVNNSYGSERRRKKLRRKRQKARVPGPQTSSYPEFEDVGEMLSLRFNRFSQEVLLILTDQEWVKELFLKDPEGICSDQLLLDPLLSHKQASKLLHLICYPKGLPRCPLAHKDDTEVKRNVARILYNLDHWTLRVSYLELALMIKQQGREHDVNCLYDIVARTTVQIFQQQSEFTSDNSPVRYGTAFTHSLFSRLRAGNVGGTIKISPRLFSTTDVSTGEGIMDTSTSGTINYSGAGTGLVGRRKRGRPPGKASGLMNSGSGSSKKKVILVNSSSGSPQAALHHPQSKGAGTLHVANKFSPNPVSSLSSPSKQGSYVNKKSPLELQPGSADPTVLAEDERNMDMSSSDSDLSGDEDEQWGEYISSDSTNYGEDGAPDDYYNEETSDNEIVKECLAGANVGGLLNSKNLNETSPLGINNFTSITFNAFTAAANTSITGDANTIFNANSASAQLFSPFDTPSPHPNPNSVVTGSGGRSRKQISATSKLVKLQEKRQHGIWLVAPLIGKLPAGVRGRVLKYAGQVLESGTHWATSSLNKLEREKNAQRSCSLLNHRPFFLLIKTCLTDPRKNVVPNAHSGGSLPGSSGFAYNSSSQGVGSSLTGAPLLNGSDCGGGIMDTATDQRDHLLGSLHSQLNQLLRTSVEDRHVLWLPENARMRSDLREACRLRLSLVADMLDLVIKGGNTPASTSNNTLVADWCCLLVQIMANDVVMSSGPTIDTASSVDKDYPSGAAASSMTAASLAYDDVGAGDDADMAQDLDNLSSNHAITGDDGHKSLFYMVFDLLSTLVTSSLVNFTSPPPISNLGPVFGGIHAGGGVSYSNQVNQSAVATSFHMGVSFGGIFQPGDSSNGLAHGSMLRSRFVAIEEMQKKAYHTLCKKLKKEVADKMDAERLEILKILFPLPRKTEKIIVCDKWVEKASHHIPGMRNQMIGLKATEAVYVNPWEMIEGLPKSIGGPLSLSWWHANKTSSYPPLSHLEDYRSLLLHTHHLSTRARMSSPDYFTKPLENLPEIPLAERNLPLDLHPGGNLGASADPQLLVSPHHTGAVPLTMLSPHLPSSDKMAMTPGSNVPDDTSSYAVQHLPPPYNNSNLSSQGSSNQKMVLGPGTYHGSFEIGKIPGSLTSDPSSQYNQGMGVFESHHQQQFHHQQQHPSQNQMQGSFLGPSGETSGSRGVNENMFTGQQQPIRAPYNCQQPLLSMGVQPTPYQSGQRFKGASKAGDTLGENTLSNPTASSATPTAIKKPKQTRRRRQPRTSNSNTTKAQTNKATAVMATQSQPNRPEITNMGPRGPIILNKLPQQLGNMAQSMYPGLQHGLISENQQQQGHTRNSQHEYIWSNDMGELPRDASMDLRYINRNESSIASYERHMSGMTDSKAALSSMLRSKHPSGSSTPLPNPSQSMGGSNPHVHMQQQQQHHILQHQLQPGSNSFVGNAPKPSLPPFRSQGQRQQLQQSPNLFQQQQQRPPLSSAVGGPTHLRYGDMGPSPLMSLGQSVSIDASISNNNGSGGLFAHYTQNQQMGGLQQSDGPKNDPYSHDNFSYAPPPAPGAIYGGNVAPNPNINVHHHQQQQHMSQRKQTQVPTGYGAANPSIPSRMASTPAPYSDSGYGEVHSTARAKAGGHSGLPRHSGQLKYGGENVPGNKVTGGHEPSAASASATNIFDQFDFDNDDSSKTPHVDPSSLFSSTRALMRDGSTGQGFSRGFDESAFHKMSKINMPAGPGDKTSKKPPSYSSYAGTQGAMVGQEKKPPTMVKGPAPSLMPQQNRGQPTQQLGPRGVMPGPGSTSLRPSPQTYHHTDPSGGYGHQQYLSNPSGSTIGYSQNQQQQQQQQAPIMHHHHHSQQQAQQSYNYITNRQAPNQQQNNQGFGPPQGTAAPSNYYSAHGGSNGQQMSGNVVSYGQSSNNPTNMGGPQQIANQHQLMNNPNGSFYNNTNLNPVPNQPPNNGGHRYGSGDGQNYYQN